MKWWGLLLLALVSAAVVGNMVCPGDNLTQLRAERDSAKADRDSTWLKVDSLIDAVDAAQKATDSLKAINHSADTVLITRIKYLAPKVAHADSVAPLDTIWRPIAFEAINQRDSALAGWHGANAIIARLDTTLNDQRQALWEADKYHDKAEKRIGQLEDQIMEPSFKLFGILPLPKLQVTYGIDPTDHFRLRPVAGLGYTVKFGRKHLPKPSD